MWDLLFYAKADQAGLEESIVVEEVLGPLFRLRAEILGTGAIRDVSVQCKRDVAAYSTRYNKNGSWPMEEIASYWQGTRRYRLSETASLDEATDGPSVEVPDMASAEAVAEFLAWSLGNPAAGSHVALVLWSHASAFGTGLLKGKLRTMGSAGALRKFMEAATTSEPTPADGSGEAEDPNLIGMHGLPVLAEGLRQGLRAAKREKIDVLAFNSCLMACVEAAHEFRDVATYLVGSEELTPFRQWNHQAWTARLALRRQTSPLELARILVDTYHVSRTPDSTISAVRLGRVSTLTQAIRHFVDKAHALDGAGWKGIVAARAQVEHYAKELYDRRYHVFTVDIIHVFRAMAREVPALAEAAGSVVAACADTVADNAAGIERLGDPYGSHGLSIFFPASQADFQSTLFRHRYQPGGTNSPTFVAQSGWREFLDEYLKRAG